jgi:hypothetical protein
MQIWLDADRANTDRHGVTTWESHDDMAAVVDRTMFWHPVVGPREFQRLLDVAYDWHAWVQRCRFSRP